MNKDQAKDYIEANLNAGDSLIGFFQAVRPPNLWLIFLIGPLYVLSMKMYFIAVSKKGIFFHQLNMFGKFKEQDFFNFNEIETVDIGKGIMQRPMKFIFKNKRKLKIKAQLKGVQKIAKLTPDVQEYIETQISLSK